MFLLSPSRVLLTWPLFYVQGLTALRPDLGVFHRVSPHSLECIWHKRVTFWVPTHAPQPLVTRSEGVSALRSHPTPSYPGHDPLMSRIYPKGLPEVAWILHESGCSLLALVLWPWSHLSLLFITVSELGGPEASVVSLPPWSFLPMGIRE